MGKRNGAFLWIKEENGREKPLVSLPFGGDEPVGLRFVVLCKGLFRIGRMLLSALPRGESWMLYCALWMCASLSSVFCAFSLIGTQYAAMADAARCDGQCSVLRWPVPGRWGGWFLALGLEGWQGGFCGCVERAAGLHKGM